MDWVMVWHASRFDLYKLPKSYLESDKKNIFWKKNTIENNLEKSKLKDNNTLLSQVGLYTVQFEFGRKRKNKHLWLNLTYIMRFFRTLTQSRELVLLILITVST